jgi:hypothetical protein
MKHAAVAILFVFLFVTQTSVQDDDRADMTFNLGKSWRLELDPDDQPYPDYLADPRRPRMEVGVGVADSEIPSASSTRVMLDLGTRYTLLKITPVKEGKNEFALDIEAVFSPNSIRAMGWTSSAGTAAAGCLPVGLERQGGGAGRLSSHLGPPGGRIHRADRTTTHQLHPRRPGLRFGVVP